MCLLLQGACTKLFHRAQLELFARYGECSRWDGLVQRLTLYVDDAREVPKEVRESFERRKDKLRERRTFPHQDAVQVRGNCAMV